MRIRLCFKLEEIVVWLNGSIDQHWDYVDFVMDRVETQSEVICVSGSNEASAIWFGNGNSFEIQVTHRYLDENTQD